MDAECRGLIGLQMLLSGGHMRSVAGHIAKTPFEAIRRLSRNMGVSPDPSLRGGKLPRYPSLLQAQGSSDWQHKVLAISQLLGV